MLTEAQITDLSKLIGENYVTTQQALPVATAALSGAAVTAIESELGALITVYNTIENKHLRMKGGKDGIDLDYDRDRTSLMKRARILLGMTPVSESEVDANSIRVLELCGARWF